MCFLTWKGKSFNGLIGASYLVEELATHQWKRLAFPEPVSPFPEVEVRLVRRAEQQKVTRMLMQKSPKLTYMRIHVTLTS